MMDFVLCEIFVDLINTARHVIVGFIEEITSFLLKLQELVSGSSGFFSSFVCFLLGFGQAGLDVFEPEYQVCSDHDAIAWQRRTSQQPWCLGLASQARLSSW